MKTYQKVAPTVAIVLSLMALCLGGAVASGRTVITSSSQIKKGAVTSRALHNNTVRSADVANGGVRSTDLAPSSVEGEAIAPESVGPEEVAFPAPVEVVLPPGQEASATAGSEFTQVASVNQYQKSSGETDLEVSWTGTAGAGFSPCVFQLRVDGQAAAPNGGEAYAANSTATSVSPTATWQGLPAGPHEVEVWARTTTVGGGGSPCAVGPGEASVGQTFVEQELVH